jgi:hypothetical protein
VTEPAQRPASVHAHKDFNFNSRSRPSGMVILCAQLDIMYGARNSHLTLKLCFYDVFRPVLRIITCSEVYLLHLQAAAIITCEDV